MLKRKVKMLQVILLIIVSFIIAGCAVVGLSNKGLMSSTDIVRKQDEIRSKILKGEGLDVGKEIKILDGQILIDSSFFGMNSVHRNNIAVRNHLLLAVLYNMEGKIDSVRKKYKRAKELINYNLVNDTVWSEGPSYFLYTEEMIDLYLDMVEQDNFLLNVKEKCRIWIKKYITPDNFLPPIGDTWKVKWEESKYVAEKTMCYDSEQTLYKTENIYLLVRHPSHMHKYIKNGHIHYDVGDIVVYYSGKCVIFPVGYNGFEKKIKSKLYDLRNKNSIYLKNLSEPLWRLGYFRLNEIRREKDHIRISYIINGKSVVRFVYIEKNKVRITDVGTDGINLNVDVHKCGIEIVDGKKMELKKGYHVDNSGKIVKNDRVLVPSDSGTTSIIVSFK
jgi:hypothetical protein